MGITKMEHRYLTARGKIIDYVLDCAKDYNMGNQSVYDRFDFLCEILESCFDCKVINEKPKIISIIYEYSNPYKAHKADYVY